MTDNVQSEETKQGCQVEFGQKFGLGVLMLVPTVLGMIYLYSLTHSYAVSVIWIALMPVLYWAIITGKICGKTAE